MARNVARRLAQCKPGILYIGVDLGLDRNVAEVITERAECLARLQFGNDRGSFEYFRRRLETLRVRQQATGVLVAMEPTNYFWKLLAAYLEEHQVPYCLVNAFTVRRHREGDQIDRSKDDDRDAFTIADLARTGKFTETHLVHGAYAELQACVALSERLRREMARHETVIWSIVGQVFPELRTVFRDLTGDTAVALLRTHAAATVMRAVPEQEFIAHVRANFHGTRLMVSKLRQLHALAAASVGLSDGVQGQSLALRLHIDSISFLRDQVRQAEEAVGGAFQVLPEAPYLLSMHGLGLMTAATILAEIGDPHRYRSGYQLIKLAGTQPTADTSGRKSSSKTPMSHQGRPRLRTALYFACLRLIQVNDDFAQAYARYQRRTENPLTKMQAVGVLMNKLLRILWALMRGHTFYRMASVQAT
jgi:transposase